MGNYFSNLFDDSSSPVSSPSASYTLTPVTSTTTTTDVTSSPNTSPAVCKDGSAPKSVSTTTTTTSNSPIPSKQVQSSSDSEFMDFIHDIFNATTYTLIFWIVAMYVAYKLGKLVFANRGANNETSGVSSYSRTIDIAILLILGIYLFQLYYYLPEENKKNIFGYTFTWSEQYLDNPWSLFELIWFTIIFFALVYILRVPMDPSVKPVTVGIVEHKIWYIYATFAIIYFFKYVLGIPIVTLIFNNSIVKYFEDVPPFSTPASDIFSSLDNDLNSSPSAKGTTSITDNVLVASPAACEPEKQVFNVSNNLYNYEEAQKVCAAFDASLATYDQVETSYNNGAEWCNYGWSEGQMAYFPTQKETWEKLQNNPNTKHACGRPGINGGFIDNPYIRFGANCYGIKAPQPDGWEPPSYDYAACQEDNSEKDELEKLRNSAKLNSFNDKNWSRY